VLIQWSRVLEKLLVSQLVKEFHTFYGTQKGSKFTRDHIVPD